MELCRKLESVGVSFLTVHGRTIKQKSTEAEPVDLEAIQTIRKSVQIPVVANGDVFSLEDAQRTAKVCRQLFKGKEGWKESTAGDWCCWSYGGSGSVGKPSNVCWTFDHSSLVCSGLVHRGSQCETFLLQDWVRLALSTGTHFTCFHHHLIYMLSSSLGKAERKAFNALTSTAAVLDYMQNHWGLHLSTTPSSPSEALLGL